MSDRRFPRWVFDAGEEPDPRFTLANERTFLAWIGVALALIAGGVALETLNAPLQPVLRAVAAGVLLLLGFSVPLLSWLAWGATERAIRQGTPLPGSFVITPLAIGVCLVAALVGAGAMLR